MCTAVTYHTKDYYFGRNLDLSYSYEEAVTITPRNYPFHFRQVPDMNSHYAMIGMAYVKEDYPLYYDGVNEMGLAAAGLNFPGNAVYNECILGMENIAPFEFIPWILGQCGTVKDARAKLKSVNLVNIDFSENLPLAPLHWMIADKGNVITVEPMKEGLRIYENPVGVLANNPPFDFMMQNLSNYRNISSRASVNRFSEEIDLPVYCEGLAAVGLPGDYSSASRLVKASFVKLNSVSGDSEEESVSQFFHILNSVEMPRGCVDLGEGKYDYTIYSSCMNQDKGIYYYITYDNRQIQEVNLWSAELDGAGLIRYLIEK